MTIIFGIIGIIGSFFLIKYREYIGDTMGEGEWMNYVGGVYNLVIIVAVFIFFWSIAAITGTQGILLKPILSLLPGLHQTAPATSTTTGF